MNITISPTLLSGRIAAIPSKSQAHRLLICSAFADRPTDLICPESNRDMEATAACLRSLGAGITRTESGYRVVPAEVIPQSATLPCCESGSTLRFLLPVAGALGVDATFLLEGRLPERPLSPLWELMEQNGCRLSRPTASTIRCTGKLCGGEMSIAGNVSSQFISGLLLAASVMEDAAHIQIEGKLESAPYVKMTQLALEQFGVNSDGYHVDGGRNLHSPGNIRVEGDWSNAAFFLAAKGLGNPVQIDNLNAASPQGDRAAADLIPALESYQVIDASDIPDLVPILAVFAGAKQGAKFINVGRLRLKESDRIESTQNLLRALGAEAESTADTLTVFPGSYHACTVDACNDHRIAMSAAIAATVSSGPVTILGAQCTEKSYPSFWNVYRELGGNYEQHLR